MLNIKDKNFLKSCVGLYLGANEHYNSLEICKECDKYRKNIHTCPEKRDKIIFKQPQLFIWEWIHEYKNIAFDRQCWTTGKYLQMRYLQKKKREEKRKGNMT